MARFAHVLVSLGVLAAFYIGYRYTARPWYQNRIEGLAPVLNEDSPLRIPESYIVVLLEYHSLDKHIAALREAHVDLTASIHRGQELPDGFRWYEAPLDDAALNVVREQDDVAWVECNVAVLTPKVEYGESRGDPKVPEWPSFEEEPVWIARATPKSTGGTAGH